MSFAAFRSLALFGASALAQQYAGETIPNTLPAVYGAELAYFRISDPAGANTATLLNYQSLGSDGQRLKESNIERAVIIIHGQLRDANDYFYVAANALATADPALGPTKDNVAIISPMFTNEKDQGTAYPYEESNALAWTGAEWAYGRNNIYPAYSTNTSSFHVLDEIVAYYQDETLFPNMHEVVVAAHSMGAQLVQRYAALTAVSSSDRVKVTFWPSDPNSYVWLSNARPSGPFVDCPTYDNYPEGFSNYAADNQQYATALVAAGSEAIQANYQSKQISYLRSTKDQGDYTITGCGAYSSGPDRDVRFLNFMNMFPPACDNVAGGNCDTVDYVEEGHDADAAALSQPGMSRLFYDNFKGLNDRAFDFGPRRTTGDSPFPGQ
jgi:pimeloyl-ACP methyl ester carboxylesterase